MKSLRLIFPRLRSILRKLKREPIFQAFTDLWLFLRVALGVMIFWQFCSVYREDSYVLKPFSVTPKLVVHGYAGTSVVQQVIGKINEIKDYKDNSTSRSSSFRQMGKAFKEAQIVPFEEGKEGGNFDLDAWFKLGRKVLDKPDKIIVGNIFSIPGADTNAILISIQMTDKPIKTFVASRASAEKLDTMIQDIAIAILEETNTFELFDYYIKTERLNKADTLLTKLEVENHKSHNEKGNFRLQVSRIIWDLAKAKDIGRDSTSIQSQKYQAVVKHALNRADELLEKDKDDLASYTLKLSCIMSAYSRAALYTPNSPLIVDYQNQFKDAYDRFKKRSESWWGGLRSEFFKRKDAEISIYTSIGHLLKSVEPKNTVTIEKYFFTAYDKDSTNVFTLNTIAYYFSDRKHQSDAEFYIKKALEINPSDGNLYDTYADILLSFNDTTTVFWDTFEKVLKNPKPIDGITMESYRFDPRWEVLYPNDKFRNLMCRYGAGAFCPQKEIGIQKSSPLATLHKPTPKPHALNRLAPKKQPMSQVASDSALSYSTAVRK